ncbi:phage antirepressor KilAC domain-containing protein [Sunxiuqinia indica]|uniref:phage antirepressor KilAC domain-containing protein n=1 Tax=Sunxiuqinia indica TaxID=2692584 RepID=UPI0013592164|nr:phage antirepressor KilAC domain-containing protein [Sunxiuqinia indica]
MTELIKIHEHKGQKVVSARELHAFLGSKRQFADWIKQRISQYGFIDGQDYTTFHKIVNRSKTTEYAITTDMAKELCMVENNDRGRLARRYFIEKENEYRQLVKQFQIPNTFAEALKLAAAQQEEIELKNKMIAEQKPKVLFADSVSVSAKTILIADLAKIINQNGIDIGQNRLFKWMRENGYLLSKGDYYNRPAQRYIEMGLFKLDEFVKTTADRTITSFTTRVTGKGQQYFINKFLNSKQQAS